MTRTIMRALVILYASSWLVACSLLLLKPELSLGRECGWCVGFVTDAAVFWWLAWKLRREV